MASGRIIGIRQDGLGGRVISFIFTLNLARKLGRDFSYIWRDNSECGIPFSDLFRSDLVIHESFRVLKGQNPIGYLGEKRNFVCTNLRKLRQAIKLDRNDQPSEDQQLVQESRAQVLSACDTVVVKPSLKQAFTDEALDSDYFRQQVRPREKTEQLVSEFLELIDTSNLVGVHVRRGDIVTTKRPDKWVPLEAHISAMTKAIEQDSELLFFLSSDSSDIVQTLEQQFPGKIIHAPKNNLSREASGIQQALVDFLILSRCTLIQGGRSEFCRAASIWGKTPLHKVS